MKDTADFDYKKYLQLIIKKKYLFVSLTLTIMASVAITSYILPEKYEAKCTIFIEKSFISELVKGIAVAPSFEDKLRLLAYTMKSRNLLLKVFNELGIDFNSLSSEQQEKMIREFQDSTDIKVKDREGLFTITFNNKEPAIARDFVNTLVRRYIEENITSKREESTGAIKFLSEQIVAAKAKLEEAEAKADSFKQDNGNLLALNEGVLLAEISEAQQAINEITIKRRQIEGMQNIVKKNDPLKARLAVLQNKKQDLELIYTDSHPEVMETNNEIASIKEQLKTGSVRAGYAEASALEMEKISMELSLLRESENNKNRLIARKQSQLRNIPVVRTGLYEFEREKNSQKNLYEQLIARYGQLDVSKQVEVQGKATTFRIVDPAVLPTRPFSPKPVKMMMLGILGGLIASFSFLVLLDFLDKSVRNVDALKSLGIQVLAVVPKIENPVELEALRRRDYWFYGVAAACFMFILATTNHELMRYLSVDIISAADIKTQMKSFTLK